MTFRKRQPLDPSQENAERTFFNERDVSDFAKQDRVKTSNTWLVIVKWIFFLSLFSVLGILAASIANAQEHDLSSDRINNAESGQILFFTGNGHFEKAIHLNTAVDIKINGMIAKVNYTQTFTNNSDDWREAVYVFPLSENAAVNEMEMRIDDRIILAEIKEKSEARQIYEQAKTEGKKAALTEQQRPNLFTQKIANIAPHEQIEVSLSYIQPIEYDAGSFGFHLPTTLTPRFIPGISVISVDEPDAEKELISSPFGWATSTNMVADAHEISPFMLSGQSVSLSTNSPNNLLNPISINIELNPGIELEKIESRNHKIRQQQNADHHLYQISLLNREESMDRDFWLEWRPVANVQPEATVFEEQIDGESYALLMLMPPQIDPTFNNSNNQNLKAMSLGREVIFIIDTSGSMSGSSIGQAKVSLQMALGRLHSHDRFNIIEFNSSHRSLFKNPVSATNHNLERASAFVRALSSGGGTNMYPALDRALTMDSDEELVKQILFITDGSIGNEEQLFDLIESKLGKARLFNVGIGSAPNSHFMSRSAQFGRGTYEYISNQHEITERMSNLFRKLESPVLGDLKITWPSGLYGEIEQFPTRLPDLYAGEPLILSVKANANIPLTGQVQISGSTSGAHWSRTLNLTNQNQHQGVATVWAREKISSLMDEKILGRAESEVRQAIIEIALPHKLITSYTSLVAVEQRISRDSPFPLKPGIVPNAIAQGQTQQAMTYPQTATSMPMHILLGNLFLLLLAAMYRSNILVFFKKAKYGLIKRRELNTSSQIQSFK